MPKFVTISNTSPLLYLHLVGKLNLLPELYDEVLVPPAVHTELQAGAAQGVNVPELDILSWVHITPLASESLIPLVIDLGRGEAEVIALGLEYPKSRLILDDSLARRIAKHNNLHITGTLGILVKAKQAGLLPLVAPVITNLRSIGLWLSDMLIADVLHQAGE